MIRLVPYDPEWPARFQRLRAALLAALYVYKGDQGIAGREAFRADSDDVPRGGKARRWPKHHVYVCHADGRELRRHIAFRDALRASPPLVARHAALKRTLAHDSGDDREAYTEGKSDFVEEVISGTAP